jgi:fatty acid desaturase
MANGGGGGKKSGGQYLRERMEVMKAMRAAPSHISPAGACDFAPALDLLGVFVAHATVSRMVLRKELSAAAGAYLNAALGCNAFCVLHHCTHESISQHNAAHEAFENTAFRLGCFLIFFDDGYKQAHRAHHQRVNEPDDPDLILSHTTLGELGSLIHAVGARRSFAGIGFQADLRLIKALHLLGIASWALSSRWVQASTIGWDNVAGKLAAFEALATLRDARHAAEYGALDTTLRATWRGANVLTFALLALFFARYPHRNAAAPNDGDGDKAGSGSSGSSFYDVTYRGQGQVDLWMMGEGAHHLHHAKSDVAYTRLPAVCVEVEAARPDIKARSRGNADLRTLEHGGELPPKLGSAADAPPETAKAFQRARAEALGDALQRILAGDAPAAVRGMAAAALDNALHACTTADRALLRSLHKQMGLRGKYQPAGHPLPMASWHETVLADETVAELTAASGRIRAAVAAVASAVGARAPRVGSEEQMKQHYFDFFVALADEMTSPGERTLFYQRYAERFPGADGSDGGQAGGSAARRAEVLARVREFLESKVPDDFARGGDERRRGTGTHRKTRARVGRMLFPRSNL